MASLHASLNVLRRCGLTTQLPTIATTLYPHLFPLLPASSLILVISYSVPNCHICGHLIALLPVGARSDILSIVLDRAAGKAGGIYEESQKERRDLIQALRRSEYGVGQMPVVVSLLLEQISVIHSFHQG